VKLRAFVRFALVVALSLTAYGAMLVLGVPVDLARRIRGRRRRAYALRGRILRLWSRSMVRALKVRVEVTGTPPTPPFFLVSNHLSYLDVVVYGSQVPCVFVARGDLADWPVAGRLSRSAGTVYIDRGRKRDIPRVLGRIDEVLADGAGVIVFPEGTSSAGEHVLPFRASLLDIPARDATPVSWSAISYRPVPGAPPPHRTVCWWGGMPFGSHALALLALPEIRAVIAWGDAPIADRDRKALAQRLHSAVDRRFRPVVSGNPLLGGGEAR
jgi:1-acyl-sn-glycerol-3-phosphate acyltransferase